MKLECDQPYDMDNWDLLDPLADLETDPLADDGLDAFVNLDRFLMEDSLFDDNIQVTADTERPVLESNVSMLCPETFDTTNSSNDPHFKITASTSKTLPEQKEKSGNRKRKLGSTAVLKTSMFEIMAPARSGSTSDSQLDHDYSSKIKKKCVDSNVETAETQDASFVVEGDEPDKQSVRRMKNNVASKRSREQRKQKIADMDQEAEELITANEKLRLKISELEKLAQELKAQLVAKMTGK